MTNTPASAPAASNPAADVLIHNQGTIFLFELRTTQAREWVALNVQPEPWQMFGHSLAVEHRYAQLLADALQSDGLVVK